MASTAAYVTNMINTVAAADPTLRIKHPDVVIGKLIRMAEARPSHLHVISGELCCGGVFSNADFKGGDIDFDMTMTKYWVDGVRGPSSHAILTRYPSLSQSFKDATVALYQKYYPIEVNPHITPQERFKAMEEWWIQAHELIVGLGLTRDMISSMVLSTPVIFRPKLREVMSWCTDHSVPFLVFSAGLYDIIKEVIEKAGLKSESVHVVSNRMRWEKEVCVGFEEPMIHVCNKNEANVEGAPYSVTLKGRDHVILMGDSLGDLDMASGLTPEVLLTIGFLNHNTEQLLPSYMDAFDVVVIDDSGMDFALSILKLMEKRL